MLHQVRRCALAAFLLSAWIVLLFVDHSHGSGPWLWAALAATWAALALAVARTQIRRRRYVRSIDEP